MTIKYNQRKLFWWNLNQYVYDSRTTTGTGFFFLLFSLQANSFSSCQNIGPVFTPGLISDDQYTQFLCISLVQFIGQVTFLYSVNV
jgi:hypothetical protein